MTRTAAAHPAPPGGLLARRLRWWEEGGSASAAAAARLVQSLHTPSSQTGTPRPTSDSAPPPGPPAPTLEQRISARPAPHHPAPIRPFPLRLPRPCWPGQASHPRRCPALPRGPHHTQLRPTHPALPSSPRPSSGVASRPNKKLNAANNKIFSTWTHHRLDSPLRRRLDLLRVYHSNTWKETVLRILVHVKHRSSERNLTVSDTNQLEQWERSFHSGARFGLRLPVSPLAAPFKLRGF